MYLTLVPPVTKAHENPNASAKGFRTVEICFASSLVGDIINAPTPKQKKRFRVNKCKSIF